ncbi:MAG TPA: glycosyl transferase [Cyanobacteria bacterium UBA8530]|nr:glycosyl transferase [Cyanobacteria bacterium UBA8530]
MRIALLAPVALAVPPMGYGGTEVIVHHLAEGLVARGQDVTLFATGDSRSTAKLSFLFRHGLLAEGFSRKNELFLLEAAHVSRALKKAGEFDVVHDHTKAMGTILSDFIETPCLTTVHNDFTLERKGIYQAHPDHAFVSISQAQARHCPSLRFLGTVYNGIDLEPIPFQAKKEDYLLFLGRISRDKGPDAAIRAAKETNSPLILAGMVEDEDYMKTLLPSIDGTRIRYVGEVGGRLKWRLLAGARALLFPIRWEEPFGLVLIEAMACGTPVISLDRGAAREVVAHGRTGLVLEKEGELAEAILRLGEFAPFDCRHWVAEHFSASRMVDRYLEVYKRALDERVEGHFFSPSE